MPILDLPPNSPEPTSTPETPETPSRIVINSARYGELAEHELVRLLDTLDDDRSRSRFRESVYISVIVYLLIGWFVLYGPRVLFHQGKIVNPAEILKQRELTQLTTPQDLARQLARQKPVKPPVIDTKTMKQLETMRKSAPPAPTAKPLPPTPQPQQAAPQPTAPPPSAVQTPQPRPTPPPMPAAPTPAIPDSPRPTQQATRPNFTTPSQNPGQAIQQAARDAARGSGAELPSGGGSGSKSGAGTGMEILSDTQGVDFDAYLRRLLSDVRRTWIPLIPEEARPPLNKRGITQVRFTILPDGRLGAMHLDGSTHDTAIDRAAWGAIVGVGTYQALPAAYKGNLELRISFYVNTEPQ
jgi:outer membrane biosynthesis protein TonB